jgi:predicted permease
MRLYRRMLYVLRQRRNAAELAEEIDFHRQLAEQEQQAAGLSPDEAAIGARRQMGNRTQASEDARRVWLASWIESVLQDLCYAVRSLAHQPSFTVLALLALGLGIGLNTSLFTVFNAVALRPWPVRDPGRVVNLLMTSPKHPDRYAGLSLAEYRYLRDHSWTLAGAIAMRNEEVRLGRRSQGSRGRCHFVSANYFSLLGVDMAIGRGFAPDEDSIDSPHAVAVLNYRTWQTRYAGDPGIVGRLIHVNDVPFTVIGVADEDFTGTSMEKRDLWVPFATLPLVRPHDEWPRQMLVSPRHCCSDVAARLAPGVTREQAQSELTALAQQFQAELGEEAHHIAVAGSTFLFRPDRKRKIIPAMTLFTAALVSVLLLACANVSNLLLARASARQREIAVRLSLGAGRSRIVRQLLTESLLLALIAGGFGLALAYVLPGFVLRHMTEDPPPILMEPDHRVLMYAIGIAVFSAIAFGLVPALRGTGFRVNEALKQQSAHASPRFPLRGLLLAVQVTISVVLLVSAGLFLRGLEQARSHDPGFRLSGVTLAAVELPVNRYDRVRGGAYFVELMKRLEPVATGGAVAIAASAPLGNSRSMTSFRLPGENAERDTAILIQQVSSRYFDVLGIPVVVGHAFEPAGSERNGIMVNETTARRLWPSDNALGKVIITGGNRPREVIGVVRDAELYGFGSVDLTYFEPFTSGQRGVILMRDESGGSAQRYAAEVVAESERDAVAGIYTIAEQVDRWLGPLRTGAILATALGILALVLASVGVYGVIAYSVEQRRREIGVRMALGAQRGEVVRFIVRANARAVVSGLAIGVAISLVVPRLAQSAFSGVSGLDPLVWSGVIAVLLAAGVLASVIPARRAARLDPIRALHYE